MADSTHETKSQSAGKNRSLLILLLGFFCFEYVVRDSRGKQVRGELTKKIRIGVVRLAGTEKREE